MKKEQKLLLETFYYGFGRFGSKIISFFLLPVFTHFLTTQDYGFLELINTTGKIITPLITFEISKALFRFSMDKSLSKKVVFSTTFNFAFLSSLVFISIAFVITSFNLISYDYLWIIVAMYLLTVFNNIHLQFLRATDNIKLFATMGIISTLLSALLSILFIVTFRLGYIGIIISSILTSLISILIVLLLSRQYKYYDSKILNTNLLKQMLIYTIPLLPNSMSWWIINLSDRFILKFYSGMDNLGIYSIANKFTSIYMIFLSVFYSAWQVQAIENYNSPDRDKYYSKVFNFFIFIQLTLIMAGSTIIRPLVKIMVTPAFHPSIVYIPILFTGTLFYGLSSFLGTGYLSSKKTGAAFSTTIYAAAVNLVLNLLFIPHFGIWGATCSTLIAYIILFISRLISTKKFFTIKVKVKHFLLGLLLNTIIVSITIVSDKPWIYPINISIILFWILINKKSVYGFYSLLSGIFRRKT